ncbi:MAG: ABC transporter permease [Lachnospira sp.]
MGKLLKLELRVMFRQKGFYICMAVSLLLMFLNYQALYLIDNINGYDSIMGIRSAVNRSSLSLILGIMVSLITCNDFTNNTIKNIYSKGYSRTVVYFTKYISSLLGTLIYVMAIMTFGFALGLYFTEELGTFSSLEFSAILSQIIVIIAMHSLYYAMAFVIRKTGGAVAASIFVPLLFSTFFLIADVLIKNNDFFIYKYWIDNILSSLTYMDISWSSVSNGFIFGTIYTVVFLLAGYGLQNLKWD